MVASVRTRAAFHALSRTPWRGRSGPIWVAHVPPAPVADAPVGDDPIRAAYAVGRTVGTAVVRNRVRRRLRAVIRELAGSGRLGPGTYLVGARPDAVGLRFDDLRDHVDRAATRAVHSRRRNSPPGDAHEGATP